MASALIIGVAVSLVCSMIYFTIPALRSWYSQGRLNRRYSLEREQAESRVANNVVVDVALRKRRDERAHGGFVLKDELPRVAAGD